MANTLNVFRNGAVGFIDWLGRGMLILSLAFNQDKRSNIRKNDVADETAK